MSKGSILHRRNTKKQHVAGAVKAIGLLRTIDSHDGLEKSETFGERRQWPSSSHKTEQNASEVSEVFKLQAILHESFGFG